MVDTRDSDADLRTGLQAIPPPPVSRDFDDRVLAALRTAPTPLWRIVLRVLQPAASGAAAAAAVTFLAVQLSAAVPEVPATAEPVEVIAPELLELPEDPSQYRWPLAGTPGSMVQGAQSEHTQHSGPRDGFRSRTEASSHLPVVGNARMGRASAHRCG